MCRNIWDLPGLKDAIVLIKISRTLLYIVISRIIQRVYQRHIKAEAYKTYGLTMKKIYIVYTAYVFTDISIDLKGRGEPLFQTDDPL